MSSVSFFGFSLVEDASLLAGKQLSVNTYSAIDTASRTAATIRWSQGRVLTYSLAKVYLW